MSSSTFRSLLLFGDRLPFGVFYLLLTRPTLSSLGKGGLKYSTILYPSRLNHHAFYFFFAWNLSPRTGASLYLDVFSISLNQANGRGWYTSTLDLELASLQLCVLCRGVSTVHLTIEPSVPSRMWKGSPASDCNIKRSRSSRVPTLRPLKLSWDLWGLPFEQCSSAVMANVEQLTFRRGFNQPIDGVVWPASLQKLLIDVGEEFDQPIDGVAWPASLHQLVLGEHFNQPIDRVTWPSSLQYITIGSSFNQAIDGVAWPDALQQLTLGDSFNRSMDGVSWPSLQQLTFGRGLDQPIDSVAWPASLQQLTFGLYFDHPIRRVSWPAALQQITFDFNFNQPIGGVTWPASLQRLTFGALFKQTFKGVAWPASLPRAHLG